MSDAKEELEERRRQRRNVFHMARNRAYRRLRIEHPEEFKALMDEELARLDTERLRDWGRPEPHGEVPQHYPARTPE